MADKIIKIDILTKSEHGWVLCADARAEYGPHGEKFNFSRFALTHGEAFARSLGEAIRHFGRRVASGDPVVGITLNFEDGCGEWALQVR